MFEIFDEYSFPLLDTTAMHLLRAPPRMQAIYFSVIVKSSFRGGDINANMDKNPYADQQRPLQSET